LFERLTGKQVARERKGKVEGINELNEYYPERVTTKTKADFS